MNKYLKYSLYGIGGLVALLLILVAVIAATFNPNDYKQQIIDLVKDKKNAHSPLMAISNSRSGQKLVRIWAKLRFRNTKAPLSLPL